MKKLKSICFVIALFELTLNSSVWARGGHYRSHIGELVLGMVQDQSYAMAWDMRHTAGTISYGSRYLPHNAYQPVVRVPVMS